MTLFKIFDASTPPDVAPSGCAGVLGYVGKVGYTPHVWTPEEWRRFAHLIQFPAWLPDVSAPPAADAALAVKAVRTLGWAPHLPEPHTRVIVCDLETRQEPGWYAEWAAAVTGAGFAAVAYGSVSTVGGNLAQSVWSAHYTGIPFLYPGQTVCATQFEAGPTVDYSVAGEWLMNRGGTGPRRD